MIARALRWLGWSPPPAPPLAPAPVVAADPVSPLPWAPGELARCIADGWVCAPRGAPRFDDLCRVTGARLSPLANGHGALLMLTLEGVPGEYAAMGFVKIIPERAPSDHSFARQMRRLSEAVKAREAGL